VVQEQLGQVAQVLAERLFLASINLGWWCGVVWGAGVRVVWGGVEQGVPDINQLLVSSLLSRTQLQHPQPPPPAHLKHGYVIFAVDLLPWRMANLALGQVTQQLGAALEEVEAEWVGGIGGEGRRVRCGRAWIVPEQTAASTALSKQTT